jgi:predicted short-subunit dehydrogenase-like oxidoreductase (DUF2520 family)
MSNFKEIKSITIIGNGNVAWHYYNVMHQQALDVKCVSAREEVKEEDLSKDLIIIAIKDKVIEEVASKIANRTSIMVHTSGSTDMGILKDKAPNYGVFYPLQTLTKGLQIDFSGVPLCIEANNANTLFLLKSLAQKLSNKVFEISSKQRFYLHLAAVFACNFPNHLFGTAKEILTKEDIPFDIMFPLIDQTIEKIKHNNPFDIQTGPAIRQENAIMESHKSKLDKDQREVYEVLSNKIIKKQNQKRID